MNKAKKIKILAALLLVCTQPFLSAAGSASNVLYTPSASTVSPGETFDVTVSFQNVQNAAAYAVMLDDTTLGSSGIVFKSAEEIAKNSAALFAPKPNDANDVAAAYLSAVTLNGDYVKYTFELPKNAAAGQTLTLSFSSSVLDAQNSKIAGTDGTVTIKVNAAALLGDITHDGTVDISDALMLFQHSILPDLYPISYGGRIDFNYDGKIDIADALMLFQYSILPDLYPIQWN